MRAISREALRNTSGNAAGWRAASITATATSRPPSAFWSFFVATCTLVALLKSTASAGPPAAARFMAKSAFPSVLLLVIATVAPAARMAAAIALPSGASTP